MLSDDPHTRNPHENHHLDVNSLNVRLPQVQNWLADHQPDILVLQELKLDQDKFPAAALQ